MAGFTVSHRKTTTAAGHALALISAGTARPGLFELDISSVATPTDLAGEYRVIRTTTASVGPQALTEEKLDPTGPAPLITAEGGDFTTDNVEVGAALLSISLNLRATFRWIAAPERRIWGANVADDGLAIDIVSQSYVFAVDWTAMWDE